MVRYAGSKSEILERKGSLPTSANLYKPPKRKKRDSWLGNLWGDVKGLKDVPAGIIDLAVGSGHDLAKASTQAFVPNLFGEYRLDDVAKAVFDDYKHVYGPALSGDFGTTKDRIKTHPLGPILDALTVVTGGAGGAAKLAKVAGKASSSEKLLKAAGYEKATAQDLMMSRYSPKRGHRVMDTGLTTKILRRFDVDAPELARKIKNKDYKGVLDDPILGSVLEANRFFADKSGTVWKPKSLSFDVGEGGAKYQIDLAENPAKRLRQELFAKAGASKLLRDKPVIGIERRASKQSRLMMQAERIRESRGLEDVGEALKGLKDWDKSIAYGVLQSPVLAREGRGRRVAAYDAKIAEKEQRGLQELARREGLRDAKQKKIQEFERKIQKRNVWAEKNPAKAEMHLSKAAKNVDRLDKEKAALEKHNKVIEGIRKQKAAGTLGRKRRRVDGKPIVSALELRLRENLGRLDDPKMLARLAQLEHGVDSEQFTSAAKLIDKADADYMRKTDAQFRQLLLGLAKHERAKVTPAAKEFGTRKAKAAGERPRDIEQSRSKMVPLIVSERFNDAELELLRRYLEHSEPDNVIGKIRKVLTDNPSSFDPSKSVMDLADETVGEEVAFLNRLDLGEDFVFDRPVILSHKGLSDATALDMRERGAAGAKRGHIAETEFLNIKDARNVWSVEHAIQAMDAVIRNVYYQRMFVNALGRAKRVPTGTDIKGHVRLYSDGKPSALASALESMKQFFEEDATVISGGELPDNTSEMLRLMQVLSAPQKGTDILIPQHVYDDLFPQAKSSQNLIVRGFKNLNRVWRAWVLGARPAWMVGNLVGNYLLMTLSLGALGTVKALLSAPKHAKFLDDAYSDIIRTSMSDDVMRDIMKHSVRGESLEEGSARAFFRDPKKWAEVRLKNPKQAIGDAAVLPEIGIRWNAKLVDNPMRRALFWGVLKPHVKRMQKKAKAQGIDLQPGDAARILLADSRVFDEVAQRTLTDLVNYRDLNELERKYIKSFMPFYSWIKGITTTTAKNTLDKPGRYNVLFNWIAGYGDSLSEEDFEGMPEWLRDYLSSSAGDKVVSVQAMNPWGTVASTAGFLAPSKEVEGQNPLASMGPIPKSVIEGFTRYDLLSGGTPWEVNPYRGGDADMTRQELVARRLVGSFPQYKLLEKALGGGPRSDRGALEQRTTRQEALRYLTGVDVRDLNRANARNALIREELRRRRLEQAERNRLVRESLGGGSGG